MTDATRRWLKETVVSRSSAGTSTIGLDCANRSLTAAAEATATTLTLPHTATMPATSRKVRLITCAPAMLRAGIAFGGVCLCVFVCPHKISKTTDQKLM